MKSKELLKQINEEFENLNTYLMVKGMEIIRSNERLKERITELEEQLEKTSRENYFLKRNINCN